MNILLLGGTGLIGTRLTSALTDEKCHVYILTRSQKISSDPLVEYIQYFPDDIDNTSWHSEVPEDIDIIYNLAGASLNQRWTKEAKEDILNSRIKVMDVLERFIQKRNTPEVLVNASAIGYYPTSEHMEYDERDELTPVNFLQQVVNVWERRALKFQDYGMRVVCGRIGLVLSAEGGALPLMALPYKLGFGGLLGSGKQWYSWIHIDDLVNAFLFAGADKSVTGPINLTAPAPLRQKQFGAYLSASLNRPNWFKTPKFLIDQVLGERSMLVVKGQKVMPRELLAHNFKYLYPTLDLALKEIYGR
jgi:uncharacterized protein (TIGR01777 family)